MFDSLYCKQIEFFLVLKVCIHWKIWKRNWREKDHPWLTLTCLDFSVPLSSSLKCFWLSYFKKKKKKLVIIETKDELGVSIFQNFSPSLHLHQELNFIYYLAHLFSYFLKKCNNSARFIFEFSVSRNWIF